MGSRREKGRDKGKSQGDRLQQAREEIAELQRKLKMMIERRNKGKGDGGGSTKSRDGE
jgi:hypothetical protein